MAKNKKDEPSVSEVKTQASAFEAIMEQQGEVEGFELVMSGTNSAHQKAIKNVKEARKKMTTMLHHYKNDLPFEDSELGKVGEE